MVRCNRCGEEGHAFNSCPYSVGQALRRKAISEERQVNGPISDGKAAQRREDAPTEARVDRSTAKPERPRRTHTEIAIQRGSDRPSDAGKSSRARGADAEPIPD